SSPPARSGQDSAGGKKAGSLPTAPARSSRWRWAYRAVTTGLECPAGSGEVLSSRACELDRPAAVRLYRPGHHKTSHRGEERVVAIGPKAQAVVGEFIKIGCPRCGCVGRPQRIGSPDGALGGGC